MSENDKKVKLRSAEWFGTQDKNGFMEATDSWAQPRTAGWVHALYYEPTTAGRLFRVDLDSAASELVTEHMLDHTAASGVTSLRAPSTLRTAGGSIRHRTLA